MTDTIAVQERLHEDQVLRQKCLTEFHLDGPDKRRITTRCWLDFIDKTRDFGGGIVFKRGIIKITAQGIFILCPKCKRTTQVKSAVVEHVLETLLTYKASQASTNTT